MFLKNMNQASLLCLNHMKTNNIEKVFSSSVLAAPSNSGGHVSFLVQTIETFPLPALAVQCPLLAVAAPFPAVAELVPDVK
jgi:hypothetical protein